MPVVQLRGDGAAKQLSHRVGTHLLAGRALQAAQLHDIINWTMPEPSLSVVRSGGDWSQVPKVALSREFLVGVTGLLWRVVQW
jgi:hypothetical protein